MSLHRLKTGLANIRAMAYIVRMPKLGVEMQTGVVLEWHVDVDEPVDEGDLVAEIESEKTTAEVTAREDGVLRRTFLAEGDEVEPGTAMGVVAPADADIQSLLDEVEEEGLDIDASVTGVEDTDDGADASADAAESDAAGETEPAIQRSSEAANNGDGTDARVTPKARARLQKVSLNPAAVQGTGPQGAITAADVERALEADGATTGQSAAKHSTPAPSGNGQLLATPRARKRAAERDIDLETVEGTGPHGSIRAADVNAATKTERAVSSSTESVTGANAVTDQRPLTGMRGTIAERLSASWEAPHVTINRTVDVEAALAAVEDAPDVVSVTDVLLLAVSNALEAHPAFNATLEDEVHQLYEHHNIGVAVDVENGLLTPVLEGVDEMSLVELAHSRRALIDRVQSGRYDTTDLKGGTFTVSNLGMFGVDSFTPIINPPEVAILGVGQIREEPERTDRGIAFKSVMGLSLSFDHRAVDGADAARFLQTVEAELDEAKALLEG